MLLVIWALVEDRLSGWANRKIDSAMDSGFMAAALLVIAKNMHLIIWCFVALAVLWILYDAYKQTTLGEYPEFARKQFENDLARRAEENREAARQGAPQGIQSPNYDAWDQVNEFTLVQAAYLWDGVEPSTSLKKIGKTESWFEMLKDAICNGQLKANLSLDLAIHLQKREYYLIHWPHITVSRENLHKFAKERGLRPRFLFPN